MAGDANMRHGDFTRLAEDYSRYRPDYSAVVLEAIKGLLPRSPGHTQAVDVGAGTGIWTRMLADSGFQSVIAVEPNEEMRTMGADHPENGGIEWRVGSGEETGLADQSTDLVSMASSLHWVDYHKGMSEFRRVLRPGGCFVAVWNPRYLEDSPLLLEIEAHLETIRPNIERVSSGRSGLTDALTRKLEETEGFGAVVYMESKHTIPLSRERYLGAWRSVNDLRVQLGEVGFTQFLEFVEERTGNLEVIEATYLTRAWVALRS
jgi:ubiquinone/menaquinone biosynthesis C-methylase UbiE